MGHSLPQHHQCAVRPLPFSPWLPRARPFCRGRIRRGALPCLAALPPDRASVVRALLVVCFGMSLARRGHDAICEAPNPLPLSCASATSFHILESCENCMHFDVFSNDLISRICVSAYASPPRVLSAPPAAARLFLPASLARSPRALADPSGRRVRASSHPAPCPWRWGLSAPDVGDRRAAICCRWEWCCFSSRWGARRPKRVTTRDVRAAFSRSTAVRAALPPAWQSLARAAVPPRRAMRRSRSPTRAGKREPPPPRRRRHRRHVLLPRDAWTRAGPCNTWLAGGCDTWLTLHCVTGFIFLYSQRWKYLLLLGFLSLSLALSGAMTISLSFLWGTAVGIPVGVVVGTYTQKWMVGVAVYARAPALPSLE